MVMSQGTYTFLACFAGFWLIWALVVLLCCFCSFLQRRLKHRREERLREQCLRSVEMEPLSCQPAGFPPAPPPPSLPREPAQPNVSPLLPVQVPHPMPQAAWVSMPDTDLFGKPPCYEEAVLMEDPPPPYSEVLADPRGGTYLKPGPLRVAPPPRREHQDPAPMFTSETSKPPALSVFPDRGYSSLIRLPSSQRWDSLGHLLSNMDLNHNVTPPSARPLHAARPFQTAAATATVPRREPRTRGGMEELQERLQGGEGLHRSLQGGEGLHRGLQGGEGLHRGLQGGEGLHRGLQEGEGLHRGLQGGEGLQGLPQVHRLRGLEPSCGLPTAFPLLGRSTAV